MSPEPMKIVICTTPIRPVPTDFPPFGSMAILQSLRSAGYTPTFFDIDGCRPSFKEVIDRFKKEAPDVIGISAVVSTAYGYVTKLCAHLKEVLPEVKIVLGGNLAASAELLHRHCQVDVCVVGEGERVIVNLINYFQEQRGQGEALEKLRNIKGITYLAPNGEMVSTGYEVAIPAQELTDPDWTILEQFTQVDHFLQDPMTREDFAQDPRSRQAHRAGKRMATVLTTKGCVARCTFCHRWDRGFRQIPPRTVIERVRYLMERYNVGFIMFGDENFGSDFKALDELVERIKPLDILWQVGGVRARTINLERLKKMRQAGCVALYYGFETGSSDILKVMEKNLNLSHNFKAAHATREAGLYTCFQLVLAMPGETHRTISETIEMAKQITEPLPEPPFKYLSINYIQALPGTPVYEYARVKKLIGPRPEDEHRYLMAISNIDAGDETKFLNFTAYPYLTVQSWRPRILYETTHHWYRTQAERKGGKLHSSPSSIRSYQRGGYFNLHDFRRSALFLRALYLIRWLPIGLWTALSAYRRTDKKIFLLHVWEWLTWGFKKRESFGEYRSLRRVMQDLAPAPKTQTEGAMVPLRLGR